jgi:hypothetical protein
MQFSSYERNPPPNPAPTPHPTHATTTREQGTEAVHRGNDPESTTHQPQRPAPVPSGPNSVPPTNTHPTSTFHPDHPEPTRRTTLGPTQNNQEY